MKDVVLKTHNLSKYGNQFAVDNVNMTIKRDRFMDLLDRMVLVKLH